MLEFIILMIILDILMKIKVGEKVQVTEREEEPNVNDISCYQFESLDDCMEYGEMRRNGYKGTIFDYYEWKEN